MAVAYVNSPFVPWALLARKPFAAFNPTISSVSVMLWFG